jgi:hypothetical protein
MNNINIVQPIRTQIIHIRSKDANQLTANFNTNFSVDMKNPLSTNNNEEVHISFMSVEIPYSFYNVSNSLENNSLKYTLGGVLYNFSFGNKNYDVYDLVDFMNNTANHFANQFTTTYDELENKITMLNKSGSTIVINWTQSNINKELGFLVDEADESVPNGFSSVSRFVVNLATIHSILIKSPVGASNVISTREGNSTVLQKISVDVNSFGIIYLNNQDYRQTTISQTSVIDQLVFTITDQNNRLLQLNNVNFEFSLLFEVYPKYIPEVNNRRLFAGSVNQKNPDRQNNFIERDASVEDITDDDSHPIENKSDLEHKTDRLVLDNLIQVVENNTE